MARRILGFAIDGWVEPAAAFAALFAGEPYAFWLDGNLEGTADDGDRSYLGAASPGARVALASVADDIVRVRAVGAEGPPPETVHVGGILEFLRGDLTENAIEPAVQIEPTAAVGFRLGWVGWLGYEAGAAAIGAPVASSRFPDAALLFADRALVFDHRTRTVTLLALEAPTTEPGGVDDWVADIRSALASVAAAGVAAAAGAPAAAVRPEFGPVAPQPQLSWRHDDARYLELIGECQAAIARGDAYQLCLTNEARIDVRLDPLATYLALRETSPTHHGGYLRFGDTALLSASPEQFLAVSPTGLVRTKPIKGTRPRGETVARDLELRAELEGSEKERAENVMIVDLMRNDVGRIAEVGSVEVRHLLAVESYAQVHQLVSTVEGRLAAGLTGVDAVAACFPAGSMTGAPKLSAMRILHGLEAGPRGVYSGCFGYFGLDGAVDLAMVIRSIVLDPDGASVGAGGGITALSVPEEELAEVRLKAAALLAALGF
ncbi:MAG TPA: aminodeoxychorismate synthase component I [Microbacteriaceae bacterium]|nr:aminodeoxychorismate synthase component I [Microbacteriaceae bacterium]